MYIGQTTNTVKERWRQHCKSYETPLSVDIQKFGEGKFSVIILADNIPESSLDEMERFYIRQYDTLEENGGYNISPGGHVVTQRTRDRLSNSRIGLKLVTHNKPMKNKSKGKVPPYVNRYKPVKGTHLITGEIIELESMSSDSRFDPRLLSAVCRGKRRHHHGYKWEYIACLS